MVRHKPRYLDAAGCRSIRGHKQIIFRSSKKSKFTRTGKFFYGLIILVFLGAIIYSIFFSQFLAVTKIEISGTENLDPVEIRKIVENEISGKFLNLIPRNNILLASKTAIEKNILEKYKYAEKAEIRKEFPDSLMIGIKERKFSSILCSAGSCAVVDSNGMAFAKADFEKNELGESSLLILYDDGNKNFALGKIVFDQNYINYLLGIREKMKSELGVDMERELRTPQIASGDIRAKTAEGWLIYFDKGILLDREIGMLKIVLENKIDQGQRSELEYIDLRTDNKIYYKFRNSEEQAADQPALLEDKKN
ncbi:MAG: FtsQ-type POTRA domain-containing protein [Parcubacteria group bacterium]